MATKQSTRKREDLTEGDSLMGVKQICNELRLTGLMRNYVLKRFHRLRLTKAQWLKILRNNKNI